MSLPHSKLVEKFVAQIKVCLYSFSVPLAFLYPGIALPTTSHIETFLLTVFPFVCPLLHLSALGFRVLVLFLILLFLPRPSSSSDLV